MKKLALLAGVLLAPFASVQADEATYTCGYFVCVPGLDVIYFAEDGDGAKRTYENAVSSCEYNRGSEFGIEVCEEVACVKNSKNGSRCNNLFIPE